MIWKAVLLTLACGFFMPSVMAARGERPRTVAQVDLSRYLAKWYEIARYPNRFQSSCAGDVTATYEMEKPGRLRVVNSCRSSSGELKEAEGVARVEAGSGGARLKVRFAPGFLSFLPFVWGDYWILELDSDYQWVVVGTPDRKYLWILSRQPQLDPAVYDMLIDRIRAQGFDPGRLVRTSQNGALQKASELTMHGGRG